MSSRFERGATASTTDNMMPLRAPALCKLLPIQTAQNQQWDKYMNKGAEDHGLRGQGELLKSSRRLYGAESWV